MLVADRKVCRLPVVGQIHAHSALIEDLFNNAIGIGFGKDGHGYTKGGCDTTHINTVDNSNATIGIDLNVDTVAIEDFGRGMVEGLALQRRIGGFEGFGLGDVGEGVAGCGVDGVGRVPRIGVHVGEFLHGVGGVIADDVSGVACKGETCEGHEQAKKEVFHSIEKLGVTLKNGRCRLAHRHKRRKVV